jgi:hypothetical protein
MKGCIASPGNLTHGPVDFVVVSVGSVNRHLITVLYLYILVA